MVIRRHISIFAFLFIVVLSFSSTYALFDPGESNKGDQGNQIASEEVHPQQSGTSSINEVVTASSDDSVKGTTPAIHIILDETTPPPPEQLAEAVQAKEYDAWRERIGGEESELWLSFDQWRDDYLASEREKAEQEKSRLAANRRNRSEKQKDSAKTNQEQIQHKNGNLNNTNENAASDSVVRDTPMISSERDNADDKNDARNQISGAPVIDSVQPNGNLESDDHGSVKSEQIQESVHSQKPEDAESIPADPVASTEQGAIPALGNPTEELSNLKHRWNFASLDCAAVVHRSNVGAKFTSSILSEKKDRYMLSPCPVNSEEKQFVIVELCEEIKIDTLVLANFEFFSRMFKRFNVHVSRNLNGGEDEWIDIGAFRARNVRGLQVFKTINPPGDARFFRYIRIDFVEHYGSEYYCPISLLRVYGLTQMDDYVREEEELRKAREAERLLLEEAERNEVEESEQGEEAGREQMEDAVQEEEIILNEAEQIEEYSDVKVQNKSENTTLSSDSHKQNENSVPINDTISPIISNSPTTSISKFETSTSVSISTIAPISTPVTNTSKPKKTSTVRWLETGDSCLIENTFEQLRHPECKKVLTSNKRKQSPTIISDSQKRQNTTNIQSAKVNANHQTQQQTSSTAQAVNPSAQSAQPSMPQQQQQQQHGGSESIYRTITKRLNVLEMNATLSLQYMEHSRHMLRETFGRMERVQREKIGQMLSELNASNWQQIENLKRRQQMDLQQALFEFDLHRQQTDAERRALLAQVRLLSNEIMLEKRFGIAQLALLLAMFVFMGLTRGSRAAAPLINEGMALLSRSSNSIPQNRNVSKASRRSFYGPIRSFSLRSRSSSSTFDSGRYAGKQGNSEKIENDVNNHLSSRFSKTNGLQPASRFSPRPRSRGFSQRGQMQHFVSNGDPRNHNQILRPKLQTHIARRPGGINAKVPMRRKLIFTPALMLPNQEKQIKEFESHWQSVSLTSGPSRRSSM